ncbi:reverse transcriptase domain-containing protein [Tanacetum coccineum]
MPFDLKNTRAAYQRLVDSTFQAQLGRNLEAYVDDMVIKIKTDKDMIIDIAETFDNLRRVNIKLNPKKCSFRVKEGKFLGYMVTSEGIRANPKKTKAVADMQSPKTLKEMQSLRQAFQELKKLIMKLPTLTTPSPKETLYVYLATSEEVVSGVLIADRKGRQTPILLRRYFEAYPIKVITDQPVKQILNKPEASVKLAKYAVELGAYNITYMPCNAVKGLKGAGVGLVLIDPARTEYTYAIRLKFSSTNNEAEYEALLAGLQIAEKMKVQVLKVKVDSKLVACQLNGEFMASSNGMAKCAKQIGLSGIQPLDERNTGRGLECEIGRGSRDERHSGGRRGQLDDSNYQMPRRRHLVKRRERSKRPPDENKPIHDGGKNFVQEVISIPNVKMCGSITGKLYYKGSP